MQNKANLPDAQMNISPVLTKDYENIANWKLGENKANTKPIKANQSQSNPIQTQNKPNALDAQMNVSSVLTKYYENEPRLRTPGKQTQTNPILSADLSAEALAKSEALAKADSNPSFEGLTQMIEIGLGEFLGLPIGVNYSSC